MASPSGLLTPTRRWPAFGAGVACLVAGAALLLTGPGPAEFGAAPVGARTTGGAVVAGDRAAAVASGTGTAAGSPEAGAPAVIGAVPVELALPGRGVRAPVVPVGTTPDGAMVVPDPPSTVGWWAPGPLAGSASGAAVLAGHVDTAQAGPGALAVLREVGPGEEVVVRGADGRELRHVVTARREYRKADLPPALFTGGGPPGGLVLVTCGGAFDPVTGRYEDNVVVHAVPA